MTALWASKIFNTFLIQTHLTLRKYVMERPTEHLSPITPAHCPPEPQLIHKMSNDCLNEKKTSPRFTNESKPRAQMYPNKDLAAAGGGAPPSNLPPEVESVVGDMISSLERRRLYREVTVALRSGLRDSSADFSFLRLRGLRNLLKSLRTIADSDAAIRLFRLCQTINAKVESFSSSNWYSPNI